jgi:CTP-dependent riboflavin kinase
MDKEVAKLNKDNDELTKELVATRSTASSWEKKAMAAEAQVKKDREASDGIIRDYANKYKELEEAIFQDCRRILGKYLNLNLPSPRASRVRKHAGFSIFHGIDLR